MLYKILFNLKLKKNIIQWLCGFVISTVRQEFSVWMRGNKIFIKIVQFPMNLDNWNVNHKIMKLPEKATIVVQNLIEHVETIITYNNHLIQVRKRLKRN